MAHETDYQRARRQRSEVKEHGVTGSTPREATKRIKEHMASKMKHDFHSGMPGKAIMPTKKEWNSKDYK